MSHFFRYHEPHFFTEDHDSGVEMVDTEDGVDDVEDEVDSQENEDLKECTREMMLEGGKVKCNMFTLLTRSFSTLTDNNTMYFTVFSSKAVKDVFCPVARDIGKETKDAIEAWTRFVSKESPAEVASSSLATLMSMGPCK